MFIFCDTSKLEAIKQMTILIEKFGSYSRNLTEKDFTCGKIYNTIERHYGVMISLIIGE